MSQEQSQSLDTLMADARALRADGKNVEARDIYYRAFKLDPTKNFDAIMGVGECSLILNDFDAGLQCFAIAQRMRPDDVAAVFNLGAAHEMQGDPAAAIQYYQRAQQLRPRDHTRLLAQTRQPVMFDSADEIRTWRARLEQNIAQLQRENLRVENERIPAPLLNIAYQGFNDREVQANYASLIQPPPDEPLLPRRDRRIHVGFISAFLRTHTIGRITRGLIANLARDEFHVTALSVGRHDDEYANFIRAEADAYVDLPTGSLPDARRAIREQALDVLIYMDIGMERLTYNLAFSRLARVQCVTWGHPSTTGIPAIDHFISTALFESDEAPQHYTERLAQLPNVPVYYYRPKLPDPMQPRGLFGWDDSFNVYGCLQSLFKLHPDFDAILDGILQRDPRGVILIPRGSAKHWEAVLNRRLRRTMPDTFERVRFFEPLAYPQYLNLTALCDVALAPVHFGAGSTSYEAFAFGVPTITLPSNMMKGRITHGLYRAMNVMDCVANSPEHYVDLAVRIATDRELRQHVSDKILAANHVLYENPAGVRDLENFLRDVANAA